jgi:hypothetical protein
MTVYILKTRLGDGEAQTIAVYKKSSYQEAYNRIAAISEASGNAAHPEGNGLPVAGDYQVALQTIDPETRESWFLERWECR